MADPVPYTVTYDFSGYQTINPASPLPAPEMDIEFANIAEAIGELVAALSGVRRADDKLQNKTVSWDTLSDDLKVKIGNAPDERWILTEEGTIVVVGGLVPGDINPASFATQVEAQAAEAADRLLSPVRGKDLINALRAFASLAESQAGVVEDKVLSPKGGMDLLAAKRAFATLAQAQAGTSETVILSPKRGADLIDNVRKVSRKTQSLTWGSIGAGGSTEQSINVPGAAVGDRVVIGLPSSGIDAGLIPVAWASAANTVRVRLSNITGGAITPYSGAATNFEVTVLAF